MILDLHKNPEYLAEDASAARTPSSVRPAGDPPKLNEAVLWECGEESGLSIRGSHIDQNQWENGAPGCATPFGKGGCGGYPATEKAANGGSRGARARGRRQELWRWPKVLGKSESDGGLSWLVELDAERAINVNGIPFGKAPD